MTYGEIFEEFLTETHIDRQVIEDYRPCSEMFGVPNIANAIVIWLRNGAKIIYISREYMKTPCIYNELSGSEPTINNCLTCSSYFEFPYTWCCLEECGEHEFCAGCERGIYKMKGEING